MTELVHIHTELAPGDVLPTDSARSQLLRVVDGVVYVRGDDDEAVLVTGDSMLLDAGEPLRVWNAGDDAARVQVVERGSGISRVAAKAA